MEEEKHAKQLPVKDATPTIAKPRLRKSRRNRNTVQPNPSFPGAVTVVGSLVALGGGAFYLWSNPTASIGLVKGASSIAGSVLGWQ